MARSRKGWRTSIFSNALAGSARKNLGRFQSRRFHHRPQAAALDDVGVAVRIVIAHHHVFKIRMERHGHAGGQGPGRGGPDDHPKFAPRQSRIERRRVRRYRVAHVDRRAAVVFVFHFRFGQRRFAGDAPVNRLAPAINIAPVEECQKRFGNARFVVKIHRQVRLVPLAENPQAHKVLALNVHKFLRELAALAPHFDGRSSGPCVPPNSLSTLISMGKPWQSQPGR